MKKTIKIKPLKWFKDNCELVERGYYVYPKQETSTTREWFSNKMKPFCNEEIEVTYIKSENMYEYREGFMIIMFEDWMIATINEVRNERNRV